MKARQQNSVVHPIGFLLISSVDHIAGAATPVITVFVISKDGGRSWTTPAGRLVPSSYGWQSWAPAAADRDTLGELEIHIEAIGCDPVDEKYDIVPYDPYAYPSLAPSERIALSDALLTRDWTQITGTVPARCMLNALRFLRNRWWVAPGGQLVVTAEDNVTAAWTGQVTVDAGADPITGLSPT